MEGRLTTSNAGISSSRSSSIFPALHTSICSKCVPLGVCSESFNSFFSQSKLKCSFGAFTRYSIVFSPAVISSIFLMRLSIEIIFHSQNIVLIVVRLSSKTALMVGKIVHSLSDASFAKADVLSTNRDIPPIHRAAIFEIFIKNFS